MHSFWRLEFGSVNLVGCTSVLTRQGTNLGEGGVPSPERVRPLLLEFGTGTVPARIGGSVDRIVRIARSPGRLSMLNCSCSLTPIPSAKTSPLHANDFTHVTSVPARHPALIPSLSCHGCSSRPIHRHSIAILYYISSFLFVVFRQDILYVCVYMHTLGYSYSLSM